MTLVKKISNFALFPMLIVVFTYLGIKNRLSRRPAVSGWMECDLDMRFEAKPRSRL